MDKRGFFFSLETLLSEKRTVFLGALVALLLVFPLFGFSRYIMRIAIVICVYSLLTLALNLVAGYTGQLSLGNAGLYAIGAYTSTVLMIRLHLSFWLTLPLAALCAGLCGLLLGLPTFRLKGSYLTIVTLGFGEIVRMILQNWDAVTNGTLGIRNIPLPVFFGIKLTLANHGLYYLAVSLMLIAALFCRNVLSSKIGRAFVSIREDEIASQMMGVKVTNYKLLAFVLSAAISGIAGAFYAPMVGYIDPNSFTFEVSSQIISMAILGGLGTMRGMFFGSALLVIFPEVSRFMTDYRFVLYGLILVIMMRFRPQGILGWQTRLPYRFSRTAEGKLEGEGLLSLLRTPAREG